MTRKRHLFLIAVAGTILAGVVILVFNPGDSKRYSRTLPDGTVIILRGITTGTQHRLVDGNIFQRVVARLIPDAWAKKLGATVIRQNTLFNRSLIWVERRFPTNSPPAAVGAPAVPVGVPDFLVSITDNVGAEAVWPFGYLNRNTEREIQATIVEGFPSSSPTVRIDVKPNADGPARKRQASFMVPNPFFLKHHHWRGSPYPITVQHDGVTFRLDRFESIERDSRQYSDPIHSRNTSRFTEFDYQINDASKPAHQWLVRDVRVFDEAGGRWGSSGGVFRGDQHCTTQRPANGFNAE